MPLRACDHYCKLCFLTSDYSAPPIYVASMDIQRDCLYSAALIAQSKLGYIMMDIKLHCIISFHKMTSVHACTSTSFAGGSGEIGGFVFPFLETFTQHSIVYLDVQHDATVETHFRHKLRLCVLQLLF